jgi:hypothetical protein
MAVENIIRPFLLERGKIKLVFKKVQNGAAFFLDPKIIGCCKKRVAE